MNPREELKLNKDADIADTMKKRLQQFQNYQNIIVPEAAIAVLPRLEAVQAVPIVLIVSGAATRVVVEQVEAGKM